MAWALNEQRVLGEYLTLHRVISIEGTGRDLRSLGGIPPGLESGIDLRAGGQGLPVVSNGALGGKG